MRNTDKSITWWTINRWNYFKSLRHDVRLLIFVGIKLSTIYGSPYTMFTFVILDIRQTLFSLFSTYLLTYFSLLFPIEHRPQASFLQPTLDRAFLSGYIGFLSTLYVSVSSSWRNVFDYHQMNFRSYFLKM